MRYRLLVEYQGTRYHGWQGQERERTIQGELLRAAAEVFGQPVDVQGSGRTDAGVHALGQVAHLQTRRALPVEQVAIGLNDRLPPDINILEARPAADRFHARHHATGRSYLYQISRRRTAFGNPSSGGSGTASTSSRCASPPAGWSGCATSPASPTSASRRTPRRRSWSRRRSSRRPGR